MSCIAVNGHNIFVAKGLVVNCFDSVSHNFIDLSGDCKAFENDTISDIVVSTDTKYLALCTSVSKKLIVYHLPSKEKFTELSLPRSSSKIRFSHDNSFLLIADKSGDVYKYDLREGMGLSQISGHLSLLLDILQSKDKKFIISCDRDEKIKVSHYPETYDIQSYCLGHKEFVNKIEFLPHDPNILVSTSGDGTIKFWSFIDGTLIESIDTFLFYKNDEIKRHLASELLQDGLSVNTMPVTNLTVTRIKENKSLIAVTIYGYSRILLFSCETKHKFTCSFECSVPLEYITTTIQFDNLYLYVYNNVDCILFVYEILLFDDSIKYNIKQTINLFCGFEFQKSVEDIHIKALYKRRFDNVQEYKERKKKRLENCK